MAPPHSAATLSAAFLGAARAIADVLAGRNLGEALARETGAAPGSPLAGAVRDLAYSTLRRYGLDDFYLARLMPRTLREPQIHALLLAALARLELHPARHTTVDQAVHAAARLARGRFKPLVNAVLRSWLRRETELKTAAAQDLVARWQHPGWWIERVRRDYPDQWMALLEQDNLHPPLTLRVNRRRIGVGAYLERLAAAGLHAGVVDGGALLLQRPVPVERLPGFAEGLVSVQDAAAQMAAALLDLRDGQQVLDACAAPGGKAAHILEQADVELLALDADPARCALIAPNLARLGLRARTAVADCRDTEAWWDGRPFERILADVPCSGSGVVRRHPDIKWLRRESDLAGFARTQAGMLDALWRVLAPGGKLLYATCSVFPEENGRQVAAFAARRDDCQRLTLDNQTERQLLPQPEHDGFFYALLRKRV